MKDYEVCIERAAGGYDYFLFNLIIFRIKIKKPSIADNICECVVIRTEKNEEGIKEYYRKKGYKVTGISECTRTKNQKVPII